MKQFNRYSIIFYGLYLVSWILWHSFHYLMVGKFFQDNVLQTTSIKHSVDEKVFITKLNYISKINPANADTINKYYDIWLERVKITYSGYYLGIDKVKILSKNFRIVFYSKGEILDYSIFVPSYSDRRRWLGKSQSFHINNKIHFPINVYFFKADTTNTILDSGYVKKR